jgi:[glutamine synthetase] adenylyltransferase / [glutamine synthetase]-adenylyl-L-tyrosine phosphorylase
MTYPQDSASLGQWLRSAGIIDTQQGSALVNAIQSLPIDSDHLNALARKLPQLLIQLSDSLGSFRSLSRYLEQTVQSNDDFIANKLTSESHLLKLLRTFDLGSEPSSWILDDGVTISDALSLPETKSFAKQFAESIAKLGPLEVSRSTCVKRISQLQRSTWIDIALDQVHQQTSIETTLQRLSIVAEVIVQWAFERCFQTSCAKVGLPMRDDRVAASVTLFATKELGGHELPMSGPITLMMLADCLGKTNGARSVSNRQFFARLSHDLDDLLSGTESEIQLYQVNWANAESNGNLVGEFESTRHHYDMNGRTWERQEFLKLRSIAGGIAAGENFLRGLQPWIYRRYTTEADVAGVGILTRKILRQLSGREYLRWDDANPFQGVQLIERTIHLLQLAYGHQSESLRAINTFDALKALHRNHNLTDAQAKSLLENLQAFSQLAIETTLDQRPTKEGRFHYRRQRTAKTFEACKNTLFDILLAEQPSKQWPAEASDLVLDHSPPRAWVAHVLRDYRLGDAQAAYDLLQQMSHEELECLSTRRCRHQLARIAPQLLTLVSSTPKPINTLNFIHRITQSLGGKAVLWQLFDNAPATMKAVVRLAASSPYLTNQLTQSPGMIDELIDSLLLGRLPTQQDLHGTLSKLARHELNASTVAEFKRAFSLRIGIRHLLHKSEIRETQAALSDVADAIVSKLVSIYWQGPDVSRTQASQSAPSNKYAIFAIGRYGAKRLGFRDHLRMLLVYEDAPRRSSHDSGMLIQHVFDKLAQSVLTQIQTMSAGDRLYEAFFRWGPMQGKSQLALSLADFEYLYSTATSIDKASLSSLRFVAGDDTFAEQVITSVHDLFDEDSQLPIQQQLLQLEADLQLNSSDVAFDHRVTRAGEAAMWLAPHIANIAEGSKAFTSTDASIRNVELAAQLVTKTSIVELRKDADAQNRLSYLLNASSWSDVLVMLDQIERSLVSLILSVTSAAADQPQMQVSQTGSRDSSPFVG